MKRWVALCIACAAAASAPLSGRAQDADDDERPYEIALRNLAPFTPDPGVQLRLPDRDANPRSIHALVQLDAAVFARARQTPDFQDTLRELFAADPADDPALLLQRHLHKSAYEALIRRDVAQRLIAEESLSALDDELEALVRWIGSVPPEVKLEAALREGRYEPWALGPNDTIRLLVTFHADAFDQADAVLAELAVERARYATDIWRALLPIDRLGELVAEDSVRSAAQGPSEFRELNDSVREITQVEPVQSATVLYEPPSYQGLTGEGIAVAVMDTGIDTNHDDFWEHDALGHRTELRVKHVTATTTSPVHGTHVAGIVAGNGFQSARPNANGIVNGDKPYLWRGVAPRATILSFANVSSGGDLATQYDATVVSGADVTNDSHEQEQCLVYDGIAETVDALVLGTAAWMGQTIPARPAVWGSGNNGRSVSYRCRNFEYFGLTVASKNPIVVGATKSADQLYERSSRGPTYDGRLKPDLVAPGCTTDTDPLGIRSPAMAHPGYPDGSDNGYARACGTSAAAPVVTGVIALLFEKWRDELGSAGECEIDSKGECFPLPSTVKALLIQGATDLVGVGHTSVETQAPVAYDKGPDYATGYGMVNAAASVEIVDAGFGAQRRVVESEMVPGTVPDEYYVAVPTGAERLRVTLAWDDEPGNQLLADTVPQLENDLDLELISPSNVTALPWIVPAPLPNVDAFGNHIPNVPDMLNAADFGPATTGVDSRNNVEQVEVTKPDPGTWTVRVKGNKLPYGSTQQYSLASDYALVSAPSTTGPVPRPPTNLCVDVDWVRVGGRLRVIFEPRTTCGFVPMESLCRYVIACPACGLFGRCTGIRLDLTGVPEAVRIGVRGRGGTPVARDESAGRTRTLRWDIAAGEKYGLFFESRAGLPEGRHTIDLAAAQH